MSVPPPPGPPGMPSPPAPPGPPPSASSLDTAQTKEITKKAFSENIVWVRTVDTCSVSEDGSGGVVFVKFKGNEYPPVVVKGTSTVVQEIFAFELAFLLDIKAPRYYIVNFTQREFRQIQHNLANKVGVRAGKITKELNRPFLIIMERVPAMDIFRIVRTNGPDKVAETVADYMSNEHVLVEIGRIMILDVLLNNFDRFPLIWDNAGNLENVLFSDTPEGNVYAIDQAIYPVSKLLQQNYDKYIGKVKTLVDDIIAEDWKVTADSPIAKVRDSIKQWTNFDLTDTHMQFIRRGILQAICDVIAKLDPASVQKLKDKIACIGKIDWQNVFHDGLKAVQLEFVQDIVQIFHNNSEAVHKALKIIN